MNDRKTNYLKHFNPNHDPSNGQFTFGDGGSGSVIVKRRHRKQFESSRNSSNSDEREEPKFQTRRRVQIQRDSSDSDTENEESVKYEPKFEKNQSGVSSGSSKDAPKLTVDEPEYDSRKDNEPKLEFDGPEKTKYEPKLEFDEEKQNFEYTPKFERDQSGSSSNSKETSSGYEYKFERNQSGTGAGPGNKKQEFDYTPKFERDQSGTSSETAKKTVTKEGSGVTNSSKNDNTQQQKSIFDPYIKGGKDKPNKSPAQVYANEAGNILRGAQKINDIYSDMSRNAKIKEVKSNLWKMSDDDLRNAINRMDLEQRYMSLASRDIEAGKNNVDKFLDVAIPVTDALGSMATIASVYYDLKKSD